MVERFSWASDKVGSSFIVSSSRACSYSPINAISSFVASSLLAAPPLGDLHRSTWTCTVSKTREQGELLYILYSAPPSPTGWLYFTTAWSCDVTWSQQRDHVTSRDHAVVNAWRHMITLLWSCDVTLSCCCECVTSRDHAVVNAWRHMITLLWSCDVTLSGCCECVTSHDHAVVIMWRHIIMLLWMRDVTWSRCCECVTLVSFLNSLMRIVSGRPLGVSSNPKEPMDPNGDPNWIIGPCCRGPLPV